MKINTLFSDKDGKDIPVIAMDGRKLGSNIFPEINTTANYSNALKTYNFNLKGYENVEINFYGHKSLI